MSVRLQALHPGFMTLTVTYQFKNVLLKASVTVGAYLPLKVSPLIIIVQFFPCYEHLG